MSDTAVGLLCLLWLWAFLWVWATLWREWEGRYKPKHAKRGTPW